MTRVCCAFQGERNARLRIHSAAESTETRLLRIIVLVRRFHSRDFHVERNIVIKLPLSLHETNVLVTIVRDINR